MPLDVSLVIVSYNTRELLRDCLASVRAKTCGVDYEIFVVDNASSDGSREMVKREFPKACLIENQENRGFAKANNQAIRMARGEFVVLLNSDTVLENDALGAMRAFLRTHPRAAVCGPLLLSPDGTVQQSIAVHVTGRSLLRKTIVAGTRFAAGSKYHPDRFDYSSQSQVRDGWLTGACVMIRHTVFDQVGLLDERYFFAMEDADWGLAVSRSGRETWFVPGAVVTHYQGASGQSWLGTEMEIQSKVRGHQQTIAFLQKNCGKFSAMGYRAAMAILLAGNLVRRALSPILFASQRGQNASFKRNLAQRMLLATFACGNAQAIGHNAEKSGRPSSLRGVSRTSGVAGTHCVAIVMQRATQFDGPLFAKLARDEQWTLRVYYTAPGARAVAVIDPEIGICPEWGAMATAGYTYETRTSGIFGGLRFIRKIVEERPDLIIVSGYRPLFHLLVALYAWLRRVPVGLRSDSTLQHSGTARGSFKGILKRFFLGILLKLYSTVHPVGTLAGEYLRHYGASRERVFPFPYAVDNEWFRVMSSKYRTRRSELRRELGIAEDAFVVLGILKFHEREDPITLVRGFAELLAKHGSYHLLLVGDGSLRGEIGTIIHDKGILQATRPGYAPYADLPKYYAVADVFVHPGVGESWGVSVNESMACGVPVVLSDRIGSHVDLVREGETGLVFKTKDPHSLAQCLAKMASDRKVCGTMGDNARALVEKWGYDATEQSLLKALQYVSSRARRPQAKATETMSDTQTVSCSR